MNDIIATEIANSEREGLLDGTEQPLWAYVSLAQRIVEALAAGGFEVVRREPAA